MICGYRWDVGEESSPRMALVHHCSLDLDHVGEPHACRCGASAPFNHDDGETQAVEGS